MRARHRLVTLFCLLISVSVAFGQTVSLQPFPLAGPGALAVDSSLGNLYVVNGSGTVSVITLTSQAVTSTVTVGSSPSGVAVNTATHLVYVTNYQSNTVSIIDPTNNFATTTVAAGTNPLAIAVNPINGNVYVATYTGDFSTLGVTIISPASGNSATRVSTSSAYPNALAVDPNSGTVSTASEASLALFAILG